MRRGVSGKAAAIGPELALGMDATLEGAEREVAQVRAILTSAIDGLIREFGERAVSEGVVALQFQDLADQLLASVRRRIEMVRIALGKQVVAPAGAAQGAAPLARGTAEFF
ncbi:MAG TPA: hypothetical protein VM051_10680 [Usitatibacter sp.]|nr:hypothetical protein [Usitatibacter sp.]